MGTLKDKLKTDLTAALRAHDEAAKSSLRMAIGAIVNEEVAGKVARALTDAEEQAVVAREVNKRKDSAEAYTAGGRPELAAKELSEAQFLSGYLPEQLSDADIAALVAEEIAAAHAASGDKPTLKQMGAIIKAVNARAAGRADVKAVANAVKAALG